jgi:hypothetical protein
MTQLLEPAHEGRVVEQGRRDVVGQLGVGGFDPGQAGLVDR